MVSHCLFAVRKGPSLVIISEDQNEVKTQSLIGRAVVRGHTTSCVGDLAINKLHTVFNLIFSETSKAKSRFKMVRNSSGDVASYIVRISPQKRSRDCLARPNKLTFQAG
jgi:hypothetical protein